jgi:hypothetical protein
VNVLDQYLRQQPCAGHGNTEGGPEYRGAKAFLLRTARSSNPLRLGHVSGTIGMTMSEVSAFHLP